jgi:hypothetical protein
VDEFGEQDVWSRLFFYFGVANCFFQLF